MGRRRNGARAWSDQTDWLHVRPAGLGLQALDTTEGVPGLLPVMLSPAGRSRAL